MSMYGTKQILADELGDFSVYLGDKFFSAIDIDGEYQAAVPIETYGFTLADFYDVPLNEFGLKEVASSQFDSLVVTANGLFVQYSGNIPSLRGMPSKVQAISGMWVDENEEVRSPRISVFSKAEMATHVVLAMSTSFRQVPSKALGCLHTVVTQEKTVPLGEEKVLCTYLTREIMPSKYIHLYPGYSEEHMDIYNMMLGFDDDRSIRTAQLKPNVLPV